MCTGDGGEDARFWLQVFFQLRNQGVQDGLSAVRHGVKGSSETITTTWRYTVVPQCVVHVIRTFSRHASRQHRDGTVKTLTAVFTAPSEQAVKDRFDQYAAENGVNSTRAS